MNAPLDLKDNDAILFSWTKMFRKDKSEILDSDPNGQIVKYMVFIKSSYKPIIEFADKPIYASIQLIEIMDDGRPNEVMHELFEQIITEEQGKEAVKNVIKNLELYKKP